MSRPELSRIEDDMKNIMLRLDKIEKIDGGQSDDDSSDIAADEEIDSIINDLYKD